MVNHKNTKRKRDIKTKLMAAICMLMVSVIMMVSTTYAWFTLSTAPEVTGINTAVGANGNLEMALMPADAMAQSANNFGITSEAGDSANSLDLKNETWGNLVDLSYINVTTSRNYYGLDEITLNPSALNVVDGKLLPAMLKTPSYGADGRVDTLLENTMTGIFEENTFVPSESGMGVRAVGTASGMTDRQLAYRNARSAANTAMSQAKTSASQSLSTNGASLANVAMKKATDENPSFNQADIASLQAIVNDLLGYKYEPATGDGADYVKVVTTVEKTLSDGTPTTETYISYHSTTAGAGDHKLVQTGVGTLDLIESAYLKYILAYGASKAAQEAGMDDTEYSAFAGIVNSADTLSEALTELGKYNVAMSEMETKATALAATRTTVETAFAELDALKGDSIAWNDLSPALTKLANINTMEVNDIPVPEVKENMQLLINSVLSGAGINVAIASGGGVYADIADHCGDFNAAIELEKVSYGDLSVGPVTARMATKSAQTIPYLVLVSAVVEDAKAPESGEGSQVMPISDFYGYIIDLAFRTNAAESDLLLQTEAADRIYNNNGADAETMGHGATMTFTSTTTDFTIAQMKELMGAIRVVFFDPMQGNKVLGNAKLDMAHVEEVGGTTVTAGLYLYKTVAGTTTYEAATAEQIAAGKAGTIKLYTEAETDGTKTYTEVTDLSTIVDDGAYFVQKITADGEQMLTGTDAKITALPQNTATAVSVLVYLDGENIGNDDVAASAATSMTGTMNLQFASSANLIPMDYTPLIVAGTTTEGN